MRLSKLLGAISMAALVGAAHGAPTLIHDYQLNGTLADALGGPALVAAGGTLGGSGYTFNANQGLSLSNGLAGNGNYSIEMRFSFITIGGYRKILDFKDLSSDNGLYALDDALNFYPVATAGTAFASDVIVDVVLTRDSATNAVNGYLNGVNMWSFVDASSLAVFSSANNIVQFFKDDFVTSGDEASDGFVDYIRIYDSALAAADAMCLQSNNPSACNIPGGGTVPEPGSLALLGLGLVGIAARRRAAR